MKNFKEFTVEDCQKYPEVDRLKKLAEGVVQLTAKGFPPKRMDNYWVGQCVELSGMGWLVTLVLENSEKRCVKFDYAYFAKDSVVWMGISEEIFQQKLSTEEFLKCLPL